MSAAPIAITSASVVARRKPVVRIVVVFPAMPQAAYVATLYARPDTIHGVGKLIKPPEWAMFVVGRGGRGRIVQSGAPSRAVNLSLRTVSKATDQHEVAPKALPEYSAVWNC